MHVTQIPIHKYSPRKLIIDWVMAVGYGGDGDDDGDTGGATGAIEKKPLVG